MFREQSLLVLAQSSTLMQSASNIVPVNPHALSYWSAEMMNSLSEKQLAAK
jgi:hypothetical protein